VGATRAIQAYRRGGRASLALVVLFGFACEVPNPAYDLELYPDDAAVSTGGGMTTGSAGATGAGGLMSGSGGETGTGGVVAAGGTAGNPFPPDTFDAAVVDAAPMPSADAMVVMPPDAFIRDLGMPDVAPAVCPASAVVDWSWWDFQTGGLLRFANGQTGSGVWNLIADQIMGGDTSTLAGLIIPGGRDGSTSGIRYQLKGYGGWGAGMSGKFSPDKNDTFSLLGKRGIRFFARAHAGGNTTITVRLVTRATDPSQGICSTCKGHFEATVAVTGTWQEHLICRDQLTLAAGKVVPHPQLDLTAATGIQFVSPGSTGQREIWIDDIAAFR